MSWLLAKNIGFMTLTNLQNVQRMHDSQLLLTKQMLAHEMQYHIDMTYMLTWIIVSLPDAPAKTQRETDLSNV